MSAPPVSCDMYGNLALNQRNQLVLEQLPQVQCIARQIHARLPHHIQLEDLVNTGVLGLIEALAKFDPDRNVQLQSYARYRIQGAILDSLREQDWGTRLLRQKARQLEAAREDLRTRLGRSPSQAEIAAELGISDSQFQQLLCDLQGLEITSLQEPAFSEGLCLGDKTADPAEASPFDLCQRSEMNDLLKHAMSNLPARKRQVLELYYFKGLTMKETGIRMGVCESRISQIHSSALASLKARMREVLLSRQNKEKLDTISRAKEGGPATSPLPSRQPKPIGHPFGDTQRSTSTGAQRQLPTRRRKKNWPALSLRLSGREHKVIITPCAPVEEKSEDARLS